MSCQTAVRNHAKLLTANGPEWLSRYSDLLRAGRSWDRITRARFSAPLQIGPGVHSASCTMGNGSFPRVKRPGSGLFRVNFTFTFYVLDLIAGVQKILKISNYHRKILDVRMVMRR